MFRHRLLLLGLLGFLGGVAIASFVILHSAIFWALLFLGILVSIVRHPTAIMIGVTVLACALGIWRTEARLAQPSALWDVAAGSPKVVLEGYVDGDFKRTAHGGRYPFRVLRITNDETIYNVNERVLVYGPDWVRPRFGQELTLRGTLRQPTNGDAGFDYVSWLAKNGIAAQISYPQYGVPEHLLVPLGQRITRTVGSSVRGLRYAVRDTILESVPQPAAGYLIGILVGDEADIDPALQDLFSRTGTSHILVVSGYNITIVAGAFMASLGFLGRRKAYWFAIAGVSAFTLLVGAAPSVVRAAIMGLLVLTARQLGRSQGATTAILLSAAAMCAFNPLVLRWDAGFQLSFLAVAGLVYIEPVVRPFWKRLLRREFISSTAATTFAAQLAVAPLLLTQFGTLAPYTLPVNMVILPLVPVAMALAGITAAAGILWPFLGALVGQIAWLLAALQLLIIRLADSMPFASLEVSFSGAAMLAAYIGLAAWLVSVYRGHSETLTEPIDD